MAAINVIAPTIVSNFLFFLTVLDSSYHIDKQIYSSCYELEFLKKTNFTLVNGLTDNTLMKNSKTTEAILAYLMVCFSFASR